MLGAIYLEHGLPVAGRVVHDLFDELHGQRRDNRRRARLEDEPAGAHRRTRARRARVRDGLRRPRSREDVHRPRRAWPARLFAASTGRSKKEAEQAAAETAWRAIIANDTRAS